MRLQLTLQITNGNALPLDYSRFIQAWIYKTIGQADEDFSQWLHNEGLKLTHKKFKFFTYSGISAKTKAHLDRKLLEIKSRQLQVTLSFLLPQAMKNFIKGLFEKQIGFWGDQFNGIDFYVTSVDLLPAPEFREKMLYDCRQPVVAKYKNEQGQIKFAEPENPEFIRQLCINAKSKYEAYFGKSYDDEIDLKLKKVYKRKERRDANKHVLAVGWTCEIQITASPQLQEMLYFGGIGVGNTFGCGFGGINSLNFEHKT